MLRTKLYILAANAVVVNPDEMGNKLYQKALTFGKWAAILAISYIAFMYFFNKKDKAGEHLKGVIKGVFLLVLAPTIVGALIWLASTIVA